MDLNEGQCNNYPLVEGHCFIGFSVLVKRKLSVVKRTRVAAYSVFAQTLLFLGLTR